VTARQATDHKKRHVMERLKGHLLAYIKAETKEMPPR
jgi:hypothetical protein